MPMHDWSRVDPSLYHDFHQCWTVRLCDRLNAGILPKGYSALVEPHAGFSDDLFLTVRTTTAEEALSRRANRVAIWHRLDRIVSVIEIVSPGNKAGARAVGSFVAKVREFLRAGVGVLLVDPFPPTPCDPHGLHDLIWGSFTESDELFEVPADDPLLSASYQVGDQSPVTYLEPFRVGATLPDMPAWLDQDFHVNVPLEATYTAAWEGCPAVVRHLVEHGRLPDE